MLIETELDTSAISEVALGAFGQNEKDAASDFIAHHGIKGQKWGVRRYQNPDGSLTEQGRQRYGDSRQSITRKNLTKGQVRFAKDALISLDQTPLSKNETAFKDTLKQLGKAAEESGAMNPNDFMSPYNLSRSPEQSSLFRKIYDNMPTVGHNTDEYYKKLAGEYKKNADGYRKEKMNHLDEVIEEFHPDLHKELGTEQGKDTRNFIVDAVKGFNEGDPDMVTYQHMEDIMEPFEAGYVDKKTFEKVYDGQAAEDAVDWLGYGWDSEDIKKYNGWYKNLHHSDDAADFIAHHGIKGQKWGQRRYQNSDGSLTAEGRKRYGVGPALKNAGSAAGRAIGKAIRKATGRQTDAELDAELAKARKVHERKMKVDEINDLMGKKKKLSKMTDQEVDQYINRLSKERTVRQAEKDLKRMNRSDFSNFMSDLRGAAGASVVEGVKRGVGYQVQKSFEKASDRHQKLKDAKYDEKHETDHLTELEKLTRAKNISQLKYDTVKYAKDRAKLLKGEDDTSLKDQADASKNRLDARRNDLELRALGGDTQAAEALSSVAEAKKGKGKEESSNPTPATPSITQKGLSGVSKSESGYRDVRNRPATEKVVSSIEDKPKKKKKKK